MNSLRPTSLSALHTYPLTSAERGMYLAQQLNPDSTFYNINIGIYISGVEADQVREAMGQILLAHEAFHAAYALIEGIPHRIVMEDAPQINNDTKGSGQVQLISAK